MVHTFCAVCSFRLTLYAVKFLIEALASLSHKLPPTYSKVNGSGSWWVNPIDSFVGSPLTSLMPSGDASANSMENDTFRFRILSLGTLSGLGVPLLLLPNSWAETTEARRRRVPTKYMFTEGAGATRRESRSRSRVGEKEDGHCRVSPGGLKWARQAAPRSRAVSCVASVRPMFLRACQGSKHLAAFWHRQTRASRGSSVAWSYCPYAQRVHNVTKLILVRATRSAEIFSRKSCNFLQRSTHSAGCTGQLSLPSNINYGCTPAMPIYFEEPRLYLPKRRVAHSRGTVLADGSTR